jgi:hypothetical protein
MSEQTTWVNIGAGDVVEGTNGSLWTVVERPENGEVTVQNVMTGKKVSQKPADDKPVVRVVKAAHALDVAKALTKVVLGGQELGTQKNEHDEWLCPAEFNHPGAFMSHLLIWHSVFGSAVAGQNLTVLNELHAALHSEGGPAGGYTPHVHTSDYAARTA